MAIPINPSNEGRRPGYTETVTYAQDTVRSWGKRISWGAVFAGVLVAIVTQMLLTLLGIGIGLATIDPLEESSPAAGLGTGAAIWYGVSTLLSLFVGGWVAGRLAAGPRTFDNTLHGVLTWCLTTLLTFYLLTSAVGRIVGGVSRFIGGTLSTVGTAVGTGAAAAAPGIGDAIQREAREQGIDLNNLQTEFNQVLRQTGKPGLQPEALERQADRATNQAQQTAEQAASNPQAANQSVESLFNQFFQQGENTAQQFDREAMINVVVARTDQSRQEAAQTVDNWINTYTQARQEWQQTKEQAEQKARQAADKAAAATSRGALFGFLGLTLGLVAAGFGGRMGGNSRDDDSALDHPTRETR